MKVYRIAKKAYIKDLSGEGARLYGGRWNIKGTSMLYSASNRSLATVEYLVHLPMALLPKDFFIVELTVPSRIKSITIKESTLPKDWKNYPAPFKLAELGTKWINEKSSLTLKVPSSVVKNEWNILINPNHKYFDRVEISNIEPYGFDERLFH